MRPSVPPLWLGVVVAASFIAVETLVPYPLERFTDGRALALVYVVGVVVVAIVWGLWLAAATSVVSALAFDYFHTPPLHDITIFTLHQVDDWLAMTAFLVLAVLASTLTDLARSRAEEAHRRQREAEALATQQGALRRVATLVARGVGPSEVFAAVAEEVARCLEVQDAVILRYEGDDAAIVVGAYAAPGFDHLRVGERLTLEGDNVVAMVSHIGRPARMDSYEKARGSLAARVRELGLRSRVGAAIVVGDTLWGTAVAGSSQREPLPPDTEVRIADFAELVATAVAAATARDALIASRARIVAAADDARRRLERDIHDGAQQRLVSLKLQLRLTEASVPTEQDDLKSMLSEAVSDTTDVIKELQAISRGIHPAILSAGGLPAAFDALARRSSVPVELDVVIEQRLPDSIEIAAYYVVAEALTNAAKHAVATEVRIRARNTVDSLSLSISDDGIGGAESGKGSGLIGLNDRIEVLGGRMQVDSPPGSGTKLDITIPHERCGG